MEKQSKTRIPIQKRGIRTRSKIVDAGMKLFAEKGYHNTNAIEIAAQAGIATGTFYSYFNNKKEVMAQGITCFYKQATDMMFHVAATFNVNPLNSREFVCFLIRTLVSAHEVSPDLHKNMSAMILIDKDIEDLCAEEDSKVIALVKDFLEAHKDLLRVSDLEAAATVIYRASDEIVHRVKMFTPNIDGERLLNELEDMMYRYLMKDTPEKDK